MQNLNESLNQTLQTKYPHLELAILPLSQVNKDNESKRIDSEYFKKEYLENEARLLHLNSIQFDEMIELLTDGKHGGVTFTESGVLFLKNTNIKDGFIDITERNYISHTESNETKRAEFKEGDILLSTIGTVGLSAVVPKNFPKATINQNLVRIVLRAGYLAGFVSTFLNCYFGRSQVLRMAAGNVYQMINYPNLRKIKIPQFSQDFQREIQNLVQDSHKALEDSKTLYKEAENLLCKSLGLDSPSLRASETSVAIHKNDNVDCHDLTLSNLEMTSATHSTSLAINTPPQTPPARGWAYNDSPSLACGDSQISPSRSTSGARGWVNPHNDLAQKYPHLNLSICPLSQSYGISGRLDSEYYQAKYDTIERKIKGFETIKIKDLVDYPISSGATPKAGGDDYTDSNQGIPFLRAVDLKNSRAETANFIYIKPQIHKTTLKRTQLKNSDVLFSIAGTIGRCAIFDYDFEANINQALCILRFAESKGILRLYLITFFNSQIGQIYLEKYSRQGLQTNLNLEEVGNLEIPKIDTAAQEQIALKIQKSFALRKESKSLLEIAKAKVQNAIESTANQT